jgi:hypothetical protein
MKDQLKPIGGSTFIKETWKSWKHKTHYQWQY